MIPYAENVANSTTATVSSPQSMSDFTTDLETGAIASVILPILATLGISLRFIIRYRKKISIKWDDYFILFSLPFSWALWAIWLYITIALVPYTVSTLPLENLSKFLMLLWIHDLFNVICVMLIKVSIMLFYLRAFATTRNARWCLYFVFTANIIQFIMRLANIFVSCFPLKNTWENPWNCEAGTAHFFHTLTIFTECFGLVTEFMLLIYPVPFVWRSRLGLNKKLALCVVFFTGFVTCATQAVRIYVLEAFVFSASDFGRDVTAPTLVLCALFETSLGSFIISLVAIWGPVREYVKNMWSSGVKRLSSVGGSPDSTTLPVSETRKSRNSGTLGAGFTGLTMTTGATLTVNDTVHYGGDDEVGRMEKEEKKNSVRMQEQLVNERSGLMTPSPPDDDDDDEPWGRNVGGISKA